MAPNQLIHEELLHNGKGNEREDFLFLVLRVLTLFKGAHCPKETISLFWSQELFWGSGNAIGASSPLPHADTHASCCSHGLRDQKEKKPRGRRKQDRESRAKSKGEKSEGQ